MPCSDDFSQVGTRVGNGEIMVRSGELWAVGRGRAHRVVPSMAPVSVLCMANEMLSVIACL